MAILVIEACRTAAETMVHGRVKVLDLAFFKGATGAMETRWPFGGFFLKIADEREGTHLYDDYQKELAEVPVTEDEKKSTVNLRKRYLLSWNDSISRTSNGEKTKKDGRGCRNSTNCRSLQT